jgi:hypothetical protein
MTSASGLSSPKAAAAAPTRRSAQPELCRSVVHPDQCAHAPPAEPRVDPPRLPGRRRGRRAATVTCQVFPAASKVGRQHDKTYPDGHDHCLSGAWPGGSQEGIQAWRRPVAASDRGLLGTTAATRVSRRADRAGALVSHGRCRADARPPPTGSRAPAPGGVGRRRVGKVNKPSSARRGDLRRTALPGDPTQFGVRSSSAPARLTVGVRSRDLSSRFLPRQPPRCHITGVETCHERAAVAASSPSRSPAGLISRALAHQRGRVVPSPPAMPGVRPWSPTNDAGGWTPLGFAPTSRCTHSGSGMRR